MRHDTFVGTSTRLQVKTHDLKRSLGNTMRMHRNTTAKDFLNLTGRLDGILLKILKEYISIYIWILNRLCSDLP